MYCIYTLVPFSEGPLLEVPLYTRESCHLPCMSPQVTGKAVQLPLVATCKISGSLYVYMHSRIFCFFTVDEFTSAVKVVNMIVKNDDNVIFQPIKLIVKVIFHCSNHYM